MSGYNSYIAPKISDSPNFWSKIMIFTTRTKLDKKTAFSKIRIFSKTVSRNLFPSAERGDFQTMKPELSDQSLNENQSDKPERITSVRYNVEQQMKRLKKYDSQIRFGIFL